MEIAKIHLSLHTVRVAIPLALAASGATLFLATQELEARNRSPFPVSPIPQFEERAVLPTAATAWLDQARIARQSALRSGESPASLLRRLGVPAEEARRAADLATESIEEARVKAGDRFTAFLRPDSTLDTLAVTVTGSGRLSMERQGEEWAASWRPFARSERLHVVRGAVEGSLEASLRAAGAPPQLTGRITQILQWDLDFSRDLKRGDKFEVVYEALHLDGELYNVGPVWAVRFAGSRKGGETHEAYRFDDSNVYYDGDGRPLQKMFLRSPLRYSRVTSNFTHRRFHPVLKVFRPHYGVDYGAPVGTPVQVTAHGVVTFAGWDRGGGRVVKVRHGGGYTTAYLHLSRFAAGIRPGRSVRQGDTIAYTGATGLASGPHLDYRVQLGSRWIDPLSLKSVRDLPIPPARLAAFRTLRDGLREGFTSGVVPAHLKPGTPKTSLPRYAVQPEPPAGPWRAGISGGIAR